VASAFLLSGALLAGAAVTALAQAVTIPNVHLRNFAIEGAPSSVRAGSTLNFQVTANGFPHNLAIDGNGVEVRPSTPNVMDGQSATITLQAPSQPGTYNLYCPVGQHRANGMVVTLNVVSGPAGLPATGGAGLPMLPAGLAAAGMAAGAAGVALRRRRA
jgi:plastocyanin